MTLAIRKALGRGRSGRDLRLDRQHCGVGGSLCGRAGLQAFVLIPKGAVALGKLSQSVMHGARVVEVIGNFDICLKVVRDLAERDPLRIRLVNSVNPDRIAGQKTAAFEICDQARRRADASFFAGRQCRQYHGVLGGLPANIRSAGLIGALARR